MENLSQQLRDGMDVFSADGNKVGKIRQVWFGTGGAGPASGEDETCIEVNHGFLGRDKLYIPSRVIASVEGSAVTLSVDESTMKETPSWHRKPNWLS